MASKNESFLVRHRFAIVALTLTWASAGAGVIAERHAAASSDARVWFFEVGKGAAALISDRHGRRLLIEAAPGSGVLEGLAEVLPWWDRRIDVLLIERPDAEQEAVFLATLRRYRVKEIWWSGAAPIADGWRRIAADIDRLGIPLRAIKAGDRFDFSDGHHFRILAPLEGQQGRLVTSSAAAALGIVGRLECGNDALLIAASTSLRPDARAGHGYACAYGRLRLVR